MGNTKSKPEVLSAETLAEMDALIDKMSLDEKLGQIFQVDWRALRSTRLVDALPLAWAQPVLSQWSPESPLEESFAPVVAAMTDSCLGSVLGGGGAHPDPNSAATWRQQAAALQRAAVRSACKLPLLIGNDSVHGHPNLRGATLYPHHIGLGCMTTARGEPDCDLVEQLAALSARESFACGINWLFTPCLAVPRDLRWGRAYEGFSEDAKIVAALGAAEVKGVQRSSGVPCIACVKQCAPLRRHPT